MNYFKPEKYYYIIPVAKIDTGVILEGKQGNGLSLYDYVNEKFPIIRQLDKERAEIYYRTNAKQIGATAPLIEQTKLIRYALMYLGIPEHILAIGNDHEAVEPVTGVKLKSKDGLLNTYRKSDCELETYYIPNYEEKAETFFDPDPATIEYAHKQRDELVRDIKSDLSKKGFQKRKKIEINRIEKKGTN